MKKLLLLILVLCSMSVFTDAQQRIVISSAGKIVVDTVCLNNDHTVYIDISDRINASHLSTTTASKAADQISTPRKATSSSRCKAITKKGTQCKRNAQAWSAYCWQHQ